MPVVNPVLKIWVIRKHEDYGMIEYPIAKPYDEIQQIRDAGGLQWKQEFIPWHRINYFEVYQP